MTTYPRTYAQATAVGDHLNEYDWDALVAGVNGTTVTGARAYPFSYMIRVNGADYEAIDSAHNVVYGGPDDAGSVDGADFAAVAQACINAVGSTGGKIYIKNGSYSYATAITSAYPVWIEGENQYSTVLTYTGTGIGLSLKTTVSPLQGAGVSNLTLYCSNVGADYALELCYIVNAKNNGFRNLVLKTAGQVAVHLDSCWDISFSDCYIEGDFACVLAEMSAGPYRCDAVRFFNTRFQIITGGAGSYAYKQILGTSPNFFGCTISAVKASSTGVWLAGVVGGGWYGGYFENCLNGFYTVTDTAVHQERFTAIGPYVYNVTYPVYLDTASDNNRYEQFENYGGFTATVYCATGCWGNIMGEGFSSTSSDGAGVSTLTFLSKNASGGLKFESPGDISFTDRNSGSFTTDAANYIGINHGLGGTPTCILVTLNDISYLTGQVTPWISTKNATSFVIEFVGLDGNGKTGNWTGFWYAEYKT